MRLNIHHRTRFSYASPVIESHNEVRLKPLDDAWQSCRSFQLIVEPRVTVRSYDEPGGIVHFFNLREPHAELSILVEAEVDTFGLVEEATPGRQGGWEFYGLESTRQGFAEYLTGTRMAQILPAAEQMGKEIASLGGEPAFFLDRLNTYLADTLTYAPGATHVHTTLEEFVETRRGVCQDFAHLMLAVCRSRGIPCRYVSGYLYSQDDPEAHQNPGATHAWIECLLPDGRWRPYDPTNPGKAADHYVRAHTGRDYADVVPVRGVYRGAAAEIMSVEVFVERADG
jgi:transglutaminase-like putative cysteine protease